MSIRKLIVQVENSDEQDRYTASMDDDDTRPTIAFPLGLALLFIMLLSMSGFFTCCLHWDKLRALLGASTDHDQENDHLPQKSSPPSLKVETNQRQSLPVLMPGDEVPKFIAISCPCEHPVVERQEIAVKIEKPIPLPVPLY